jgi:hypothetical protein
MYRVFGLLIALVVAADCDMVLAQVSGLQNPAGFLDPRGAAYMGTGNPPNAPLAPLGGSTLPPGAPGYYNGNSLYGREVETNPALRQEVRRPFGGGGYRGGNRAASSETPSPDGQSQGAPQDAAKSMNFSERQNTGHVEGYRDNSHGRAAGTLANDWRYVYFQRRHWYWMANNTWAVWDQDRWVTHAQFLRDHGDASSGPQVRAYRAASRGYNSAVYAQPTTRSQRLDRLATGLNDRYTGPTQPDPALTGTSGGVEPVPGANAPIQRTPQPNRAAEQRAVERAVRRDRKMLSDSEVIQGPFSAASDKLDEAVDAAPAAVP